MLSFTTTLPVLPVEIWHLVFSYFSSKKFTKHDLARICLVSKLWLTNQKYLYEQVVVMQARHAIQITKGIQHSLLLNPQLCLLVKHLKIEVEVSLFNSLLQDSFELVQKKLKIEWLFEIITNASNLESITVRSGTLRHPMLFLHVLQCLNQDILTITYKIPFHTPQPKETEDILEYLRYFKKLRRLEIDGVYLEERVITRSPIDMKLSSSLTQLLLPQTRDVGNQIINLVEQRELRHLRVTFDRELFDYLDQSNVKNLTSFAVLFRTTPTLLDIEQCSIFIAKNEKLVHLTLNCPFSASKSHISATLNLLPELPASIETLATPFLTFRNDTQRISILWNGACSGLRRWFMQDSMGQLDVIEILKETELRIPSIYTGVNSKDIKLQAAAIRELNKCNNIMGGKEQLSPSALSGLVGILKKMLELLPSSDSNLMCPLLYGIYKLRIIPGSEKLLVEDASLTSLLGILSISPFTRATSLAIDILSLILENHAEGIVPHSVEFMQTLAKRYLEFGVLNIVKNYLASDFSLEEDFSLLYPASLVHQIFLNAGKDLDIDQAVPIVNMLLKQVLTIKPDGSSLRVVTSLALFETCNHSDPGQIDAQTCTLLIPFLEIPNAVHIYHVLSIISTHCCSDGSPEQYHLSRTQIYLDAGILEKLNYLLEASAKTADVNFELILDAMVEFLESLDTIYSDRLIDTLIIQNLVAILNSHYHSLQDSSMIMVFIQLLEQVIEDCPSRIPDLIAQGVLTFFHFGISTNPVPLINAIAIDCINSILKAGEKNLETGGENPYLVSINALNMLPDIQKLQDPYILSSFKSSFDIIDKFYPEQACLNVVSSNVSSKLSSLLEEFPSTRTYEDQQEDEDGLAGMVDEVAGVVAEITT